MYPIVDNSALSSPVLQRLLFMHYTWKDCCSRASFWPCRPEIPRSFVFHDNRGHAIHANAIDHHVRVHREPDKPVLQERKSHRRHVVNFSEKSSAW